MIGLEQFAFLAAGNVAAIGEAVTTGADALWVPGGMLLTAAELLRRAALTYKEGREKDVEGARQREADAEAELTDLRRQRDDAKADRDAIIGEQGQRITDLSEQVQRLEREISQMRGDHNKALRDAEERHANELRRVQLRTEREIRVAYRLREHMATHGLEIPDDLLDTDHGQKD